MLIKKLLIVLPLLIAGCTGARDWNGGLANMPAGAPDRIGSGFYDIYGGSMPGGAEFGGAGKNVAVLLPMGGESAKLGKGLANSIQMAFIQRPDSRVSATFYDMSGDRAARRDAVTDALASMPDIVIGPLFAEDAAMVRDMKPRDLPVLSFTSDASAVGDGVMTMALMPTQSIEEAAREMSRDGRDRMVVIAPKTASGEIMAGAATAAARAHNLFVAGIFFYAPGDAESVKSAAAAAAMHDARTLAHDRAREVLSDILTAETLTAAQKSSIRSQLNRLSRTETVGPAPWDAALLLGDMNDSKTIVSFLRYYDVAAGDAGIYGTALWDGADDMSDFMMTGAKFASLPPMSDDFKHMYSQVSGTIPSRLDGFGFDAANLAIGMARSDRMPAEYLLSSGGCNGLDGLFRLRANGASERALQVMELNGTGTPTLLRHAATDFLNPLYYVNPANVSRAGAKPISGGINPMDYISIPDNLRGKYASRTFSGATSAAPENADAFEIMPEDDREIIANPEFVPITIGDVDRRLIDSVEITD